MEGQPEKLPTARQRSQTETRARLMESAIKLFAASGSINTTTKDLAAEAGVAVGTVYLHFRDKDALLEEVLKVALRHLKLELSQAATKPKDSGTLVRQKMEGLVNFTENNPELAAILFDAGNLATSAGRDALEFLTKSQENGLLAGISAGYYRGDLHAGLTARALVGILVQVLGWWARNPETARNEVVVDVLTELRLHGLDPK